MHTARTGRTIIAIFSLLIFCSGTFPGQKATDQISVEAARLHQTLASLKLPEDRAKRFENDIARVEGALKSGYLYLSLNRLRQTWTSLMLIEYQQSKAEIQKQGTEAFEKEYSQLGRRLDRKEKQLASLPSGHTPAAVKAMAEALLTQTRPYYQSGRLYGLSTTLESGLAYFGIARAYLDFALFCRQLRFPSTGHPPRLRSIEPELNKLEAEVLEAYRQPGAKDQQRLFNVVNSTLKLASELNEAKRFYGALHQYLEAYRNLCLIKAEAPGPDTLTVLKKKGESLRAQLVSGDSDHSIGLMYWEIARSVLDGVGEADKAEIKESAVILERVLPRYFELTEGMKR